VKEKRETYNCRERSAVILKGSIEPVFTEAKGGEETEVPALDLRVAKTRLVSLDGRESPTCSSPGLLEVARGDTPSVGGKGWYHLRKKERIKRP